MGRRVLTEAVTLGNIPQNISCNVNDVEKAPIFPSEREGCIDEINDLTDPIDAREVERLYWRSLNLVYRTYHQWNDIEDENAPEFPLRFDAFDLIYNLAQEWELDPDYLVNQPGTPLLDTPDNSSDIVLNGFTSDFVTNQLDPYDLAVNREPVDNHILALSEHLNRRPSHFSGVKSILRATQMGHVLHQWYRFTHREHDLQDLREVDVPPKFTELVYQQIYYRLILSMMQTPAGRDPANGYVQMVATKSEQNRELLNMAIRGDLMLDDWTLEEGTLLGVDTRELNASLSDLDLRTGIERYFTLPQVVFDNPDIYETIQFIEKNGRSKRGKAAIYNRLHRHLLEAEMNIELTKEDDLRDSKVAALLGQIVILANEYTRNSVPHRHKVLKASLNSLLNNHRSELTQLYMCINLLRPGTLEHPHWDFGDL